MSFDLPETLDILARTPAVVDALLRGTSGSWHAINEGPDTWSARDVVGHLIHGEETDWVPRARIILEHGATRPFDGVEIPESMATHDLIWSIHHSSKEVYVRIPKRAKKIRSRRLVGLMYENVDILIPETGETLSLIRDLVETGA